MNRYYRTWSILTFLVVSLLLSCEKSDPLSFSAAPGISFQYGIGGKENAINYSFLGKSDPTHTVKIPMIITGFPSDRDRVFDIQIVQDELTTATPEQYEILASTVHAGNSIDTLYIAVKNSEDLESSVAKLHLAIKENDNFQLGIQEKDDFLLQWSDQAIMPTWGVYFRTFFSAAGSTKAYRIFVETTGLTNFVAADFRNYLQAGAEALGTDFGNYIKQWNLDHPDDILVHDDGTQAGKPIVPVYYDKSKYR